MKTSKYIQTAFLVFIFGTLLILYISSKLHKPDPFKFSIVEEKLEKFSVIIAEEGANFDLVQDSIFKFEVSLIENDTSFHFPVYLVKNDTLYIQGPNYKQIKPAIHCNSITTIIGKSKNKIKFDRFAADNLILEINHGEVYGSFNDNGIKNLRIKATDNSKINFSNSKINHIELTLDKSRVSVYNNDVKTINAKLFNKSNLFARAKVNLSLQTDSTSEYSIRNSQ